MESLVRSRYFDDAEYHLHAKLRDTGEAVAEVKDWKGQTLYQAEHRDIVGDKRPYRCPSATFDLWVFILSQDSFSVRRPSVSEVRQWLSEFGGVHFFYNGLRVNPYGGPDDDWLGMNLRRVQSPEERPSTNTSIGRIDVLDSDSVLVQKTDRSGFIEDASFNELRSFARGCMDWMANRRLDEAERRRQQSRSRAPIRFSKAKRRMEEAIAATPGAGREDIEKAFASYESSRDRQIDVLQREVQLYRTLSTAGITAATFAHESSANPFKIISQSIAAIDRRATANFPIPLFSVAGECGWPCAQCRAVGGAYSCTRKAIMGKCWRCPRNCTRANFRTSDTRVSKRALGSLNAFGVLVQPSNLLDHDKRRISRVDLHGLVEDVLSTYNPFLEGRDVEIARKLDSDWLSIISPCHLSLRIWRLT